MEKLSRLTIFLVSVCTLIFNSIVAQENLCLIEIKGMPQIEVKNEFRTAKKGDVLDGTHKIQIKANDAVKLIDNSGVLYEIKKAGSFGIADVLSSKIENEKTSVTKKYFSYLYKKMFADHQNNSKAGVVYRLNPSGTLLLPKDKRQISKDTIRFEWTNEVFQPLTFTVINEKTNKRFSITTNGNYITLPIDGFTLAEGNAYKWTIMTEGDVKPIYHSFSILKKDAVSALQPKVIQFKKELSGLGFNNQNINALISDHFNIQY